MSVRVDWRQSVALTGTVIKYLAVAMLVPLGISFLYGEDTVVFLISIAIAITLGIALEQASDSHELGPREALLFVGLSWGAVAVIGAIPYVIAGYGTESALGEPVNALFESMSGFTTTGATVTNEISFARHSHALLMWRQLTQWLGGMGIIVLMVAILPEAAVNGAQLIESEAPGPELQKLTPKIAETARLLWLFYLGFTVLYILILLGLHYTGYAPNMDAYNAVAHGFTTLPTGGFSPQAESIAYFSPAVQWVVIPFMLIAGMNFALFYLLLQDEYAAFLQDRELQAYLGANAGVAVILWGLLFTGSAPPLELGGVTQGALENSLRQATFQVASLLNSTGYATSNFAEWGNTAKGVLLFAMFIGGSAGSTGGGVKIVRWLVVLKSIRRQLFTTAHPSAVKPVRLGGQVIDEDVINAIYGFTLLYLLTFGVATVFLLLDAGRVGLDLTVFEAISASLATIGNIGPGFGFLGPFGTYELFPETSKLLMIFLMWIGRLEIIPVFVIFTGAFWNE
ncbi:TrkH family potassium uptake protein [Haloarcula sp. KBTZ06]|uniref:TrkH family potassium uptake protein n=1 Tax=unclassified Haloarcula TaxID=2624677 RepID=UPI0005955BEB|nr:MULTISPECIES: TrkH family potassium uptake protein [unclassified Haloarcula]AJF26952.1 potassium transporter TrkH [Haloarcula sp. CBA1115]KAA9407251.1 TrkH family potassium uptake protein [Haloarcula sp. CBA1131]KZX48498.1 potassium transporter TrkH [Haloarcula sp. K1]MUV48770.1 TrkH family potassium uptake protein [Haloarcula sp. CBA1122]